jgi:outer membrane lipoprotein-sorting protein
MKSSLKFLLLFSLIVIGKVVKDPIATDIAAKPASANDMPVHMVSFFSRQATLQGVAPDGRGQWRVESQVQASNN